MAAGAASLSDSSIRSVPSSSSSSSSGGREVGVVVVEQVDRLAVGAVAADRLDRALVAGHEVAQDLLGDVQAVLQLDDRLGRRLEQHDVVRALRGTGRWDRPAGGGPTGRP